MSTHHQRMKEARQMRKQYGLNDAFSQQTAIRNEMVQLRAALSSLPDDDIAVLNHSKELIQNQLAELGEQLYLLLNGPTH